MSLKQEVLSLYRQLLRVARSWEAKAPNDTQVERDYIKSETKRLFRQNQKINEPDSIQQYLREGYARLEIGLHYKIPYPRPVHVPPTTVVQTVNKKYKNFEKLLESSKPIYIRSY